MGYIELRDVTKRFGDTVAADHVSLTVEKGGFTTLLGPSGCGKTTMLRLIAGFLQPDEGSIYIDGLSMDGKRPYERDLGLVFQNYALFPHLTVFRNMAFGLEMRKLSSSEIRERVNRMLALTKLEGLEERLPRELSGGQQQRVALARALVISPRVLLLDEPLSNLDLVIRHQMRSEIKTIQSELGMTTIYVTHDQGEAMSMSDVVAVMNKGRIIQVGRPAEIYEDPADEFVAKFVGEVNFIEGSVKQVLDRGLEVEISPQLTLLVSRENLDKKPGSRVVLLVRPERIRLLSDRKEATGKANTIAAKVASVTYGGSTLRHVVRAGSLDLKVDVQNAGRRTHSPGDDVVVVLEPEDIRILDES